MVVAGSTTDACARFIAERRSRIDQVNRHIKDKALMNEWWTVFGGSSPSGMILEKFRDTVVEISKTQRYKGFFKEMCGIDPLERAFNRTLLNSGEEGSLSRSHFPELICNSWFYNQLSSVFSDLDMVEQLAAALTATPEIEDDDHHEEHRRRNSTAEHLEAAKRTANRLNKEKSDHAASQKKKANDTRTRNSIDQRRELLDQHKNKKKQAIQDKIKRANRSVMIALRAKSKTERNKLSYEVEIKYGRLLQTVSALCRTIDELPLADYKENLEWLALAGTSRNASMWIGAMFTISNHISPMSQEPGAIMSALVLDRAITDGCSPPAQKFEMKLKQKAMHFVTKFRQLYKIVSRIWKKSGEQDPGSVKALVRQDEITALDECLRQVVQPFCTWANIYSTTWEDGQHAELIKNQCFAPFLNAVGLEAKAGKCPPPKCASAISFARQKNYDALVRKANDAERAARVASRPGGSSRPSSAVLPKNLPKLDPVGRALYPKKGRQLGGWRMASRGQLATLSLTPVQPIPPIGKRSKRSFGGRKTKATSDSGYLL